VARRHHEELRDLVADLVRPQVSVIVGNTPPAMEVIIRPAVMFAQDDAFLTTILRLLRSLPAYPMFGHGRTRLQPAYADDVAAAIAEVVRQSKKPYPIYELAGPRVYSYKELLRTIARSAGLRPVLMRMPFAFWNAVAGLAEILPQPPLTRNQVELMQIDTTASENRPGFRALGISPRSLEEELQAMLKHKQSSHANFGVSFLGAHRELPSRSVRVRRAMPPTGL
jgi:nucleoside-diphosphate-sugar epimerase